jgi:hypothetical protein
MAATPFGQRLLHCGNTVRRTVITLREHRSENGYYIAGTPFGERLLQTGLLQTGLNFSDAGGRGIGIARLRSLVSRHVWSSFLPLFCATAETNPT